MYFLCYHFLKCVEALNVEETKLTHSNFQKKYKRNICALHSGRSDFDFHFDFHISITIFILLNLKTQKDCRDNFCCKKHSLSY
jgi:hypothetical protein